MKPRTIVTLEGIFMLDASGFYVPADPPAAKSRWPLILYPLAAIGTSGAVFCLYRAVQAWVSA